MRAAAFAIAATLGLAAQAQAFVVDAPDGEASDPVADLIAAARWDANAESFVASGERGLGGGLEYAIDDSVCTALRFADAPDCAAVKAQIGEAMARWSVGHPAIAFTDVTGVIQPETAPATQGWIGHGAEIDFFVASADELRAVHGEAVAADTRTYYLYDPAPRDPMGREQAGARGRLTAADVRFNTDVCFHLAVDADAPGCIHFGSVVMHEIAHVLGLDHPDEHAARNLDLNADPGDAMALGCAPLNTSLAPHPSTERYAVANGRWTGAGYWTRGLTYDDYAGRDALYPHCDVETVAAASGGARRWAAFALSEGDDAAAAGAAFGWSRAAITQDEARRSAQSECARFASRCVVAAVFTDCFAMARDEAGAWGWAVRTDIAEAQQGAVANCARHGGTCRAPIAMCAAPYES